MNTFRKSVIVLLATVFLVCLVGCSSEPPTPKEAAIKIFKEAKKSSNGIVQVDFFEGIETLPARINIIYQYNPLGIGATKEDISLHMSSKIQKLYETVPEIDTAVFVVRLPYQSKYGDTTWKKGVQFTFTRELYKKINWDKFYKGELLDIAQDVTYYF